MKVKKVPRSLSTPDDNGNVRIYKIFMRLSKRLIFISSKREGKERKQLKNVIKIHLKRLHTLTYLLQNRTFYLSIIQNPQFL